MSDSRISNLKTIRSWMTGVLSEHDDLNPTSWAKKANVAVTTITRHVYPKEGEAPSIPSTTTLTKLADAAGVALPSLAEDDLRRGLPETVEIVEIPEYDVRLSAGAGSELLAENVKRRHTFAKNVIVSEMGLNPSQLSIEEVHGDSMYPTLTHGDRVMVNHADKDSWRMGIFAIYTGQGVVIKRVQVIDNVKPVKVRLISDNPLYGPLDYDPQDVNILGRVVWRAQNMV